MPAGSDRYVQLKGGLVVPIEPILLLLAFEERGLTVRRDGDDLIVGPGTALTDDDCQRIRRWKSHLLVLIDYAPPEVQ